MTTPPSDVEKEKQLTTRQAALVDSAFEEGQYESGIAMLEQLCSPTDYPSKCVTAHVRYRLTSLDALMLHTGHTSDNCSTSPSIHLRPVGRSPPTTGPHRSLRRKFPRAMRTPPSYPHLLPQSSQNAHSACSRTLIRPHLYFVPCLRILIQLTTTALLLSQTPNYLQMRIPSLPQRRSASETAKTVGTSSSPVLSNRSLKALALPPEILESGGAVTLWSSTPTWTKRILLWWLVKMLGQCLIGSCFFSRRTNCQQRLLVKVVQLGTLSRRVITELSTSSSILASSVGTNTTHQERYGV